MTTVTLNKFSSSPWTSDRKWGIQSDRLGLYIHLPYCRTKCTYCAFVSAPPQTEDEMDAYTNAIIHHLEIGAQQVEERRIETVFLGGGTPSLMGATRLGRILDSIHQHFRLSEQIEITLEANPESATQELFERTAPLGINRISMGAQSFDTDELTSIGRVHSVDDIPNAVQNAKQAGIQNISLDLIYGLPNQSFENWQMSVNKALACGLTHLSAYALTYEEGTLLHRQLKNGRVTLMDEDTYIEMYEYLQYEIQKHGFQQYEISNWCKPGYECRHNLIYWDRDEYIVFGVSAHGMIEGWRFSIHPSPKEYISYFHSAANQEHYLELDILNDKQELNAKEAAEDAMIFGLRKTEGININSFESRFGYSPLERWETHIQSFIHLDWLEQNGENLRLTKNAYLISNEVMQGFIE